MDLFEVLRDARERRVLGRADVTVNEDEVGEVVGPRHRRIVDDEDEFGDAQEAVERLRRPVECGVPREHLPWFEDVMVRVEVVKGLLHVLARAHRVEVDAEEGRHLAQELVHARPQLHLELHVLHAQGHLVAPPRPARRAVVTRAAAAAAAAAAADRASRVPRRVARATTRARGGQRAHGHRSDGHRSDRRRRLDPCADSAAVESASESSAAAARAGGRRRARLPGLRRRRRSSARSHGRRLARRRRLPAADWRTEARSECTSVSSRSARGRAGAAAGAPRATRVGIARRVALRAVLLKVAGQVAKV